MSASGTRRAPGRPSRSAQSAARGPTIAGAVNRPVNLGEPFLDLGGDHLVQEVRRAEPGGAPAAEREQVGVEQGGRVIRVSISPPYIGEGPGDGHAAGAEVRR